MTSTLILIVEDDEDDCGFLKAAINDNGFKDQLLCFNNPVDALVYLRSTNDQASIIVSDINMPYMNGISFKNEIDQDAYLNNKKIPFIFLSNYIDNLDVALKNSVAACIKKPNSTSGYRLVAKAINEISRNPEHKSF